jgi:hypothetical protein
MAHVKHQDSLQVQFPTRSTGGTFLPPTPRARVKCFNGKRGVTPYLLDYTPSSPQYPTPAQGEDNEYKSK